MNLRALGTTLPVSISVSLLLACRAQDAPPAAPHADHAARTTTALTPPIASAVPADELIAKDETHFAHLWRLTKDVDNAAEGYWSNAGDRICYQGMPRGVGCDRIFVLERDGSQHQISNGNGVTTCSYFLPGDKQLLYASTHAWEMDCPPRPDMSHGYVWAIHPEYDIYVRDLATGKERALTSSWGYDAEATISPLGDRMVFTSTRSGDIELWTCDLEGHDLKQVTKTVGYDGGAYFSHDGKWLVFRATHFAAGKEQAEIAEYKELLSRWLVQPTHMEICMIRPDGSERREITKLGHAAFAPYFFLGDKRIIFASNHLDAGDGRDFDLFAIDTDGKNLERITSTPGFDSFPMFSPNGRWLAFCSNRGGSHAHETNLFLAEWR